MLALLSPSKTLDFESDKVCSSPSTPALFDKSLQLASILKTNSKSEIQELMNLSDKLAELNFKRYQNFSNKMDKSNAKQALFAFKGDVYEGLDAESLNDKQLKIANDNIAILSGLYGVLRPFDYIQPYRLEMGTKLKNPNGKNLYDFWGDKIAEQINNLEKENIINLASNEYFKAVNKKKLVAKLIDVDFKEDKNGDGNLKTIGLYAKKARGLMARFIVEKNIHEPASLKKFDYSGYKFSKELSSDSKFIFTRKH